MGAECNFEPQGNHFETIIGDVRMTPSVMVFDLAKTYGPTRALSQLSFSVEPGSIYGLIGPNGAGKTTSLAILAGLIQATSGEARILGLPVRPGNGRLVSKIGFFSPQFPYLDYLTGVEVLSTCGLMHGLTSATTKNRTLDLLALLDLQSAGGQYLAQYSQGMRHKLGLACAMIHAPDVLLLDEPFVGLDPSAVFRLVCCLGRMAAKGRTIIVSSHDMALVERLCDRVGILHEGVLKHQIVLAGNENPGASKQPWPETHPRLESVLWEIVGAPKIPEIPWL
jgi:ABC-2 type transport system ATP-binding protein